MTDPQRRVYLAAELAWSTDPDADGSDYLPVPIKNRPYPVNGQVLEETNYATGGDAPTESIPTQDASSLDLEIAMGGYATASGDGAAAPTADVIDLILANGLGVSIDSFGGEGVAAG